MGIISSIVALARAFPTVDKWLTELEKALGQARLGIWKKENKGDVDKIRTQHDQIDAEKDLGSPTAGKLSGDAGAVVVDAPPPNIVSK